MATKCLHNCAAKCTGSKAAEIYSALVVAESQKHTNQSPKCTDESSENIESLIIKHLINFKEREKIYFITGLDLRYLIKPFIICVKSAW